MEGIFILTSCTHVLPPFILHKSGYGMSPDPSPRFAVGWVWLARLRLSCIVSDGNCLFRALSQQMYNSEVYHSTLHTIIVRFKVMNQGMFQPYMIPAGSMSR